MQSCASAAAGTLRRVASGSSRRRVGVKWLQAEGPVPYHRALQLQQQLVAQKVEAARSPRVEGGTDVLLLLQHPPTYTAGRRIRGAQETEGTRLRALGADYHEVDRGGLMTFHGPGQLIGYPILDLKSAEMSVRCFVHALEETIINTCAQLGIQAGRTQDTGVWVGNDKIAALGVHVSRHVSCHGFALNCDMDLKWFDAIVPCGIRGKGVTSLLAQGVPAEKCTVDQVVPIVRKAFQSAFQVELVDLAELDPECDRFIRDHLQQSQYKA